MTSPWPILIPLADVDRGEMRLTPEAGAEVRARIAEDIGVDSLNELKAEATLKPWLDGAELHGRFTAVVTQTCGISLDPFDSTLTGQFTVQLLPAGSKHAPAVEREVAVDPEADDPPEMLEGDVIDVGAYLVEYLALEVDPFPRKPDAVFEQPGGVEVISPFAALAALKGKDEAN